jgi:hypothetical protein
MEVTRVAGRVSDTERRIVDRDGIDSTLSDIERSLTADANASLSGTGFWRVVAAVKTDEQLVESFGERIARIDREAFERWALLKIPLVVGTGIAIAGTTVGLILVALAYSAAEPLNGIFILGGMGTLFVTLHSLAHLIVGRLAGIRFTHWFIGSIGRPQPGVKIDYESYLATPATARAWMHAAGAITTKIVPFALVPAGLIAGVPAWAVYGMVGFGIFGLITDLLWSGKHGDWKRFKREWALREY